MNQADSNSGNCSSTCSAVTVSRHGLHSRASASAMPTTGRTALKQKLGERDLLLSARQQDQDKSDHGGAAAVIDPLSRVHHEAFGGPTNQVRALARPEQAHRQEKETDEGKSAFH